jgi:hypothetical protein
MFMTLRRLHRLGFALWLGLVALTASGIAQNQLSTNVLVAAVTEGGQSASHVMPDGSVMAGSMAHGSHAHDHQADASGHSHKGHADCTLCGPVAAMAAFMVPVADVIPLPRVFATPGPIATAHITFFSAPRAPYASRAPPILIG